MTSPDSVAVAANVAAAPAESWFATRGWRPFAFQREVWAAMAAVCSGRNLWRRFCPARF